MTMYFSIVSYIYLLSEVR